MKSKISFLIIIFQSFLLPFSAVSQDLDNENTLNNPRQNYHKFINNLNSEYKKEEAEGRPSGGLSDTNLDGNGTDNGDYQGRPSGGLSDSELDGNGIDDVDYKGRPSGGLSDPELEGK